MCGDLEIVHDGELAGLSDNQSGLSCIPIMILKLA
jgi:hypothetical protein